jgi:(S)-ureidoglycine---glyoxylate transaminase
VAGSTGDLLPSPRILMGPGPTMADPRVLRAMSAPLLGQFDPEFTSVMNEVMELLRQVFQTRNERAFPVPGTGRAGLEAAMVSLLEPGDRVVIGECGRFGLLMIEIAERCGADVVPVRAEWGRIIEPDAIAKALAGGRTRIVAMVHGETSTGVLQPLEEIARIAHAHDALLMVDAVVTLGGCEVAADRWETDVAVAGTQKCLSCPSGLAPITYNARAEAVLEKRASRIQSNYLDLLQIQRYWSPVRYNHHTAPTSMVFGLREALRAVVIEGLESRFERHRLHGAALRAGLGAMGLSVFGYEPAERRLPFITPVIVPDGIDELRVRRRLVEEFGIEIGAAFGMLQGKIWRIGTMGYSARRQNVLLCLAALESVLRGEGFESATGAGVAAARDCYEKAGLMDTD